MLYHWHDIKVKMFHILGIAIKAAKHVQMSDKLTQCYYHDNLFIDELVHGYVY